MAAGIRPTVPIARLGAGNLAPGGGAGRDRRAPGWHATRPAARAAARRAARGYRRVVTTTIRLVEVLAALSLASDVGHDQPLEKSLRNAVIAARLGEELGLRATSCRRRSTSRCCARWAARATRFETAALFGGEDLAFLGLVQRFAGGDGRTWIRAASEHVAAIAPELAEVRDERWFATEGRAAGRAARDSACEVSMSLARRLGLSPRVQESLDHVYERWDGHGPGAIGGEALHLPARVSHVVDIVEIAARSGGLPAVLDVVRRRSGTHFDPAIAAVVERRASDLLDGLDDADMLEAVLEAEPPPHPRRPSSELEALARAIADFADLKSPWTLGHSPAVAELAAAAAPRRGDAATGAAHRRAAARPRPRRGAERDLGQGRPARPGAARARAAAHVLHRADPRPHARVRRLRGPRRRIARTARRGRLSPRDRRGGAVGADAPARRGGRLRGDDLRAAAPPRAGAPTPRPRSCTGRSPPGSSAARRSRRCSRPPATATRPHRRRRAG